MKMEAYAISEAKKVGNSLAGDLGSKAFIELELAYATRLLPRFSDDPIVRVNQNVLYIGILAITNQQFSKFSARRFQKV